MVMAGWGRVQMKTALIQINASRVENKLMKKMLKAASSRELKSIRLTLTSMRYAL